MMIGTEASPRGSVGGVARMVAPSTHAPRESRPSMAALLTFLWCSPNQRLNQLRNRIVERVRPYQRPRERAAERMVEISRVEVFEFDMRRCLVVNQTA